MNLFDILGPVMVGPSSSHTAGAVRMGLIARQLLGEEVREAEIVLHGSFADTGEGHGTDKALVAGLLGCTPDDEHIPASFARAAERGLSFTIVRRELRGAHPNTALLTLEGVSGAHVSVQCASIGGGRIRVEKLGDVDVSFSAEHNTLIIHNNDVPGIVAEVSSRLAGQGINIATLQLFRDKRGGRAVMVLEIDQPLSSEAAALIAAHPNVLRVNYLHVNG
ncbi:MAG: L-serine ammonia-lyase, iron-sulfur-dependent subunit beta [Oscillospiraceae bacterium]|nr:L-serine ammonia-lyase, iron-sulfur-dependent subunit beta [Oscillospiraceae bacterium]